MLIEWEDICCGSESQGHFFHRRCSCQTVCTLVEMWLYSEDMYNIVIHISSWAIISLYNTQKWNETSDTSPHSLGILYNHILYQEHESDAHMSSKSNHNFHIFSCYWRRDCKQEKKPACACHALCSKSCSICKLN